MVLQTFIKDAADEADYGIDWRKIGVLDTGDTIATSVWDVPAALLSPVAPLRSDTLTKVWLRGGTPGVKYTVTNTITTVGGRTFERSIAVKIKEL